MLANNIFFLLVVIVLVVCPTTWECEVSQTRHGCRIQSGQCLCGVGCYSEYRYTTKDECWKALKGRRYDVCQESPCLHGGTCSQTSFEPGYRCRCEGSGYYGDRCQNACPSSSDFNSSEPFPYECIVI
ncbi:protein crumbs homolog 2 [Anabrus simplex]|uniref:protein crumbs homolog 2 n=1 Tax=Anabrus simplex TaxID=316456 RepID=UPI0034DCCCAA